MSGALCPACHVPVVPGYVRCPKCHAPLPRVTFRRAGNTIDPGGTAVPSASRASLVLVILAGLVGVGLVAYLGLRGGKKAKAVVEEPVPRREAGVVTPDSPAAAVTTPRGSAAAAGVPSADVIAAALERSLKKQRLWSTVEVIGARAEVRSSSCADPAMTSSLDGAARAFKAAGLTKLRCLEQSGHVVVDRDL